MSFEGMNHQICVKGHLSSIPTCGFILEKEKCLECGSSIVWEHTEDETNGTNPDDPMNNGEIKKFLKTEAVYEEVQIVRKRDGFVIRETKMCTQEDLYNIPTTFGHRINHV